MHTRVRSEPERFLSRSACEALARRVAGFTVGGGHTDVLIDTEWMGNIRWVKNQIVMAEDVRNNHVDLKRTIRGSGAWLTLNQIDDTALHAAVRRAEGLINRRGSYEKLESEFDVVHNEPYLSPNIWSDTSYSLDVEQRIGIVRSLIQRCESAGLMSAGYIAVSAQGRAIIDTQGRSLYYPYTSAQCSITVRDPKWSGSGWAGLDHYDWGRIDAEALMDRALDKCIRSQDPVAVEPGRFTTILEPQAVRDLVGGFFSRGGPLDREKAEVMARDNTGNPFWKSPGFSKLGMKVMDERISVSADPMDPELGFPPFFYDKNQWTTDGHDKLRVYHPVVWIKNGVLNALAYTKYYAVRKLGKNTGLMSSGAYRIDVAGPTVAIEEMIATTRRGLIVSRFSEVTGSPSIETEGLTRDGLWLIENGKITRPVKSLQFRSSVMFVFNQIEQLGTPVRVFSPGDGYGPVVVPPIKVRDFWFTRLYDAV